MYIDEQWQYTVAIQLQKQLENILFPHLTHKYQKYAINTLFVMQNTATLQKAHTRILMKLMQVDHSTDNMKFPDNSRHLWPLNLVLN